MYKVTSEYLPSEDSAVTDVKTGSIPLEEKNLSITQRDVLEAGQTITAMYSGDGYDEGVFTIERSDGTTLKTDQTGTTMGTSTSLLYESTTADIRTAHRCEIQCESRCRKLRRQCGKEQL
ncbi:MAG: hypothetical protein ACLTDX_19720 [[Clostridium] innocuum]